MSNAKRYTEERGIKMLKELDIGASIASAVRTHNVTDQTTYCWRKSTSRDINELAEMTVCEMRTAS